MRTPIAITLSLLLIGCGPAESEDGPLESAPSFQFDDPEVTRIYDRMMGVIAPDRGWERARYLEFDWAVARPDGSSFVRSHRWDRWEGHVRVEDQADGQPRISLFNTRDPTAGRVWIGDDEVSGAAAEEALTSAYRAHINDSYWLVMPYKWSDPGVLTRYLGEQTDTDGQVWEVVELGFQNDVGLTPQNMYHAFINPETGRMERWFHFPDANAEPAPSDWTDWTRYGPIELGRLRKRVRVIQYPPALVERD